MYDDLLCYVAHTLSCTFIYYCYYVSANTLTILFALGTGHKFKQKLDQDEVVVCVNVLGNRDDDNDEVVGCYEPSLFNEFSTIDIIIPMGTELSVEFYLRDRTAPDNNNNTTLRAESRSFFFVLPDDKEWKGLRFSTITHVGGISDDKERGNIVDSR